MLLDQIKTLEDEQERATALDCTKSIHCESPAGAGKTEFLKQLLGELFTPSTETNRRSETENKVEGYFIPDNAIIWYANEPWVYVKHGADLFIRKPLGTARRMDDGWLLEDKLLADDELLVIKGSQTLLSEEFKWAIPDENDD